MEIQLAMVVLEVRDLDAAITFYRRLGLDVPDPVGDRPVTVHRMGSGVSLLLTTAFASMYDPQFTRPASGYQQLLEFFVGEDATVQDGVLVTVLSPAPIERSAAGLDRAGMIALHGADWG